MVEPVIIGNATLYLGDCRDILPTLGKVDAVVTDPPYGIEYQSTQPDALKFDVLQNDDGSLDLSFFLNMDCPVLAFGANNYPSQLPHRGRWLCWDKRTIDGAADAMLGQAFELAWSNKTNGYGKMLRVLHGGIVNADGHGQRRVHPTQKPISLMKSAIEWISKDASVIVDPFMGSGTTGVAAVQLGKLFVGMEIDAKYFDIACKRIEDAQKQGDLFIS
jgi:site-specific DNA-methyltransferase (adenine-specific)/modification methylase